ncbi:MAG: hypothetical protein HZB71_04025 [Betaproteobacteria bacterium]|nr:hypothetical protein [Betaproteobacteria bacterium]
MLESLAFALVKTLISFMFQQHLEESQAVRMEGAPAWYYRQAENQLCESAFAQGGLEAVEASKSNARAQLVTRINRAMDVVIYDNFRNRRDPAERDLIDRFRLDADLPVFVDGSAVDENLEYREQQRTAYARACLPKEKLVSYQTERVGKLRKSVTLHRRDRGFEEMDADVGKPAKK